MIGLTFTRTAIIGKRSRASIACYVNRSNESLDWDNIDKYDRGYLIFRSETIKTSVTLQDVKDAYECCSGIMNDQMKESCYLQFGVDSKMAEKYFKKVESMETLYFMKDEDNDTKKAKPKNKNNVTRKWFRFGNELNE